MRTNNGKVKNTIISVYFIMIVFAILMATVFSAFKDLTPNPLLTFLIIATIFIVVLLFVYFISKYFEYDSDGFKVVILNRGLLLPDHFNYRENKVEFEKDQLMGFRFSNYLIYRRLSVKIKNSRDRIRTEKFNVTLVSKKKRKYIKQSLTKIIRENRKAERS